MAAPPEAQNAHDMTIFDQEFELTHNQCVRGIDEYTQVRLQYHGKLIIGSSSQQTEYKLAAMITNNRDTAHLHESQNNKAQSVIF